MPDLITSHFWRAPTTGAPRGQGPKVDRPCEYAGCGRPRSEHADRPAVDWARFKACDVCAAGLGEPCLQLSGFRDGPVEVPAEKPHGGRQLRAGYARAGEGQ